MNELESSSSNKIRTGFTIPQWIIQKAMKIVEKANKQGGDSGQTLESETLRRKQEEKLNKLTDEMRSIKKELESMKYDMKEILSYLKNDK